MTNKTNLTSLFFNISNHPVAKWREEQLDAAHMLADTLIDIPFPQVCPDASEEQVAQMADELFGNVLNRAGDAPMSVIAHVMGEMTLTYALVSRLKSAGIKCVASTTERKTYIDAGGMKVSEFKFIKFRDY